MYAVKLRVHYVLSADRRRIYYNLRSEMLHFLYNPTIRYKITVLLSTPFGLSVITEHTLGVKMWLGVEKLTAGVCR